VKIAGVRLNKAELLVLMFVVTVFIGASCAIAFKPPSEPGRNECVFQTADGDYKYMPKRKVYREEVRREGNVTIEEFECVPGTYPTVSQAERAMKLGG
jgi:hypothetical protein